MAHREPQSQLSWGKHYNKKKKIPLRSLKFIQDKLRSQGKACRAVYCSLWDRSFDKNVKLIFEFPPAASALDAENMS